MNDLMGLPVDPALQDWLYGQQVDSRIKLQVMDYYEQRGLVMPDTEEALHFLVSEIGELSDAYVHQKKDWIRNNEKERDLAEEAADVLMMLYVLSLAADIHPFTRLIKKMKEKLDHE